MDIMKKMGKFLKSNIKLIVGIIIGAVLSGTSVYAATILFASDEVSYDNTNSVSTETTVQGALDDLYTYANTWINPSYIDFTTLATNTNKTILASEIGVCIKRNNKVSCFTAYSNTYAEEQNHLQQVFSDISCSNGMFGSVECDASDFRCVVSPVGYVNCSDKTDSSYCLVYSGSSATCN